MISKKAAVRKPVEIKKTVQTPMGEMADLVPTRPKLEPVMPVEKHGQLVLAATPAFTDFDLPTDNKLLFSSQHAAAFFQPTFSGRVISAMFGYVRDPGAKGYKRFHEGIDIRPMERDDDGEPVDDVRCAASGVVRYVCGDADGSNYGKYIVVEHSLFGAKVYTLYAHLASVQDGLEAGDEVDKGQRLGRMGRTSSEFEIDPERAHLHFEVDLMLNRHYIAWSEKCGDGEPKHGLYNGANLLGIDPVRFLLFLQRHPGAELGDYTATERVAFRALVPRREFSWLREYPFSLKKPITENTSALEVAMTYYGLPVSITPRSRKELTSSQSQALANGSFPVTYASEKELSENGCCKLMVQDGGSWSLSEKGASHLRQLIF